MQAEYLLFNIGIASSSTAGVMLYKGAKWPKLKPFATALLTVSLPYVVCDHFVTGHWWTFNPSYVLGVSLGNLPVEEVLFFFVIPWSCLIIWENFKDRVQGKLRWPIAESVSTVSTLLAAWAYLGERWYSFAVCAVVALFSLVSIRNDRYLQKKNFLAFLLGVLGLTLIFNGYLTARPVVLYSPNFMSNVLVGTIPVEDIFYGLVLVGGCVLSYEHSLKKRISL